MASFRGKELKQVIDPTLAKAFTHPLRGHVWVTLFERGVVSPAEVAAELDLEVSEVSYHFRELKRRNLIRLVRTVQRRGFDEHFYEPAAPAFHFDDDAWMELPIGIRSSFSGEMMRQVIEQMRSALEAGSFDARNRHLSQTWLLLDEEGWTELSKAMKASLDAVLQIQERCASRREESTAPSVSAMVAMASFETASGISKRKAGKNEALP